MKLQLYFMLLTLTLLPSLSDGQTLSPGDIAFVMYNTDGGDGWAFVAMTDIPSGTSLNFTTEGWNGTSFYVNSVEEIMSVTTTSPISAGTVVVVSGVTFSPSIGTVSGSALSTFAGDQILCYQGTEASPTFIAGVHGDYHALDYDPVTTWNTGATDNISSSALPSGLTNGLTAVSLFPGVSEVDNARYACALTTGTRTELLEAINDPSNWESDNDVEYLSPCTLMSFTIQAELPVELKSFNASLLQNGSVKLDWQTVSEIDNDYFTIERSPNGSDWVMVDKIIGAGTSVEAISYSATDFHPYPGTNYYRLKQTDFDGKFSYSSVEVVHADGISENVHFRISPNPATFSEASVEYMAPVDGDLTISVLTSTGVEIFTHTYTISKGLNKIDLDLSNLSSAMYYVKLEQNGIRLYKNMIVK